MTDTDLANRARLPAAVYDLALRLGVRPGDGATGVRLTQTGRIKRNLDRDAWMTFTAIQTMATDRCVFDWRAKAGPFGLISARDALVDGEGCFDIMAFGFLPLARAPHTAALVRGELMRYLAEIPWAPQAIFHNAALRWRVDGPDALAVSAGEGATASEVLLTLDRDGRLAGGFAPDRPRAAGPLVLPTPWRGRLSDYRCHDGIWLPFAAEVAWEMNGKSVTYWQGRIVTWEVQGTKH